MGLSSTYPPLLYNPDTAIVKFADLSNVSFHLIIPGVGQNRSRSVTSRKDR